MKWINTGWWRYLMSPPAQSVSRRQAFMCRARGHPHGAIFFKPCGVKPDPRCWDCLDEIA